MRVGFAYNHGVSSVLTNLFTGSGAYHVFFCDDLHIWDMNLLMRRRLLSEYDPKNLKFAECPVEVSVMFLEHKLDTYDEGYGWKDYALFALRPLYHLFGQSTRNKGGVICSEMVYEFLIEIGWTQRFVEVPSPADLERVLKPT